jgi:hypothetical protein
MNYVYILPLIDGINMKIGVSEGDLTRLLQHHETYGILWDQVRILNCRNKKLAFKVEKYLLDNIPKPSKRLIRKDGFSEIREVIHLKNCPEIISRIRKDITFTYQEAKYIEYKFYSINELQVIYKEMYDIDLSPQVEKLSTIDYTKYSTIYDTEVYHTIQTKYTFKGWWGYASDLKPKKLNKTL